MSAVDHVTIEIRQGKFNKLDLESESEYPSMQRQHYEFMAQQVLVRAPSCPSWGKVLRDYYGKPLVR